MTRTASVLSMVAFGVHCLVALPVILFKFAVDFVRDWIERKWPDSERARAVSFWIGLLAPLAMLVALAIALGFAIAHGSRWFAGW